MVNDHLDFVKMIFIKSWYSWVWGKDKIVSNNLAENGENEIWDLNRRMNRLNIEEIKYGRGYKKSKRENE